MKAPATLLTLGLALGLASVLLSAPVFALGVWRQSEPVVIAVHGGAALCWLGLALGGGLGGRLSSWLVAPVLALFAWSVLAAALSDYPMLGLLGPPQTGEGALWSLDFAGYVLAAWVIRDRHPRIFHRLVLGGAGVVAVVGLCNWPVVRAIPLMDKAPRFFDFPKFLAFSALGLFPAAWALRAAGARAWAFVLAAAVLGLVASDNRTALVGLLMLAAFLPVWRGEGRRLVWAGGLAVFLAALIPYGLLRAGDWLHAVPSLWSRSILLAVADRHIFDSLASALVGHGWGNYQEYLARFVADTGISLVDGSWKDLTRDEFHSHSAVIEAAFAAGLPGAALALLARVGLVAGAAPAALPMALAFAVTLALTEATWFMLPLSLPVLALGAAALAPRVEEGRGVSLPGAGAACVTLALTGLLLIHGVETRRLMACLKAEGCILPALPSDPRGQGLDLAAIMTRPGGVRSGALADLVRRVALRADAPASALRSLALVNTFGRAAFAPEKSRIGPLSPLDELLWRDELMRLMAVAPGRLDVAAVYLNWLVRQERDGGDDVVLPALERRSPAHPVVLWFRGLRQLTQGGEDERRAGLARLRQALDGGVGRFLRVPDEVAAMIRRAP